MDVSNLKAADTATIHVKNADGEALYDDKQPVRITLHGPGSHAASVVQARQTLRATKRYNDNEGKLPQLTVEERRAEAAEDLAALTVRFEHLTYGDKTGHDLFVAVYSDPALGFIRDQVAKAAADWALFKAGSSAS